MKRFLETVIKKDLRKKMVFITGPKQVGKTWLAKKIAASFRESLYLNYDSYGDRRIIQNEDWLEKTDLLILDELHKMKGWKNYLKGVYDTKPKHMTILVTGSARLDSFRQSGDSLAGRFFRHRLLPFTPAEIDHTGAWLDFDKLIDQGGFPEPYLAESVADANRWRLQYMDGLIRTDVLDFGKIYSLRAMEMVLELLQHRIGSPVSYKSIAEDVEISPNTVKKYVQILESLFIIFRVTPYSRNIARSTLKAPKIYFFDTGMVRGDDGARFENMTALCLLKHVYGMVDLKGVSSSLHFIRTKDKAEVDFCLVRDRRPELLIEVKQSDANPSRALVNFCNRYGMAGMQLVRNLKKEQKRKGIEIRRAKDYLRSLIT